MDRDANLVFTSRTQERASVSFQKKGFNTQKLRLLNSYTIGYDRRTGKTDRRDYATLVERLKGDSQSFTARYNNLPEWVKDNKEPTEIKIVYVKRKLELFEGLYSTLSTRYSEGILSKAKANLEQKDYNGRDKASLNIFRQVALTYGFLKGCLLKLQEHSRDDLQSMNGLHPDSIDSGIFDPAKFDRLGQHLGYTQNYGVFFGEIGSYAEITGKYFETPGKFLRQNKNSGSSHKPA